QRENRDRAAPPVQNLHGGYASAPDSAQQVYLWNRTTLEDDRGDIPKEQIERVLLFAGRASPAHTFNNDSADAAPPVRPAGDRYDDGGVGGNAVRAEVLRSVQ